MTVRPDSQPAATVSASERHFGRLTPPLSTEDCLLCIRLLGERVASRVQFMGAVGDLKGTSLEAKQKAVVAFYERLVAAERQLGRIQSDLRLG